MEVFQIIKNSEVPRGEKKQQQANFLFSSLWKMWVQLAIDLNSALRMNDYSPQWNI